MRVKPVVQSESGGTLKGEGVQTNACKEIAAD